MTTEQVKWLLNKKIEEFNGLMNLMNLMTQRMKRIESLLRELTEAK